MISKIAIAGWFVFSVSLIVRNNFFESFLSLLIVLKVEVALGDDINKAISVEDYSFFQESRCVVNNRKI